MAIYFWVLFTKLKKSGEIRNQFRKFNLYFKIITTLSTNHKVVKR